MRLRYCQYVHEDGEAKIEEAIVNNLFNGGGQDYATVVRWTIMGELIAASPAALQLKIAALDAAYSQSGDAVLLNNDGTPSNLSLYNRETVGGVRVIQRPSMTPATGAVLSGFYPYRIVLEATFPDTNVGLLEFGEEIQRSGLGGRRVVWKEVANGPPQAQTTRQRTLCRTVQSGRSIGHIRYFAPPPPLWPNYELVDRRDVTQIAPRRNGSLGGITYTEYGVRWSYYFESPQPLAGNPHVWTQ